jgi:hypothetical protein
MTARHTSSTLVPEPATAAIKRYCSFARDQIDASFNLFPNAKAGDRSSLMGSCVPSEPSFGRSAGTSSFPFHLHRQKFVLSWPLCSRLQMASVVRRKKPRPVAVYDRPAVSEKVKTSQPRLSKPRFHLDASDENRSFCPRKDSLLESPRESQLKYSTPTGGIFPSDEPIINGMIEYCPANISIGRLETVGTALQSVMIAPRFRRCPDGQISPLGPSSISIKADQPCKRGLHFSCNAAGTFVI